MADTRCTDPAADMAASMQNTTCKHMVTENIMGVGGLVTAYMYLSKFALKIESEYSLLKVGHGCEEEHVEDGAHEAGGDGHELRGGERHLVHLHPREQQQREGGGDHEGAAFVQCHDAGLQLSSLFHEVAGF